MTTPSGRVLTVGAGQQFSTLNAALAASQDGDTIAVAAGTYTNDISTVTHSVTIAGVGGLAHFQSTGLIANGKAILIDDAANLTLENLEFSGAQVADGNGAGIRYETGDLTIKNSYFHDNQDGLLGSSSIAGGHVTIDGSTFTHNGAGDGQTHGLYIGQIASLTVTNSFFQDQVAGQDVKSRAAVNLIDHNRFIETDTSANATNYQIDLPNGGNDTVSTNTVLKADNPNNYAIVHFGGEVANPVGSLLIQGNNFYSQANPSVVLTNQSLGQPIQILNNGIDLTNLNPIINGSTATATISGTSALDTATSAPSTSLVVPTALDTGITLTSASTSSGTSGRTLTVGAGQQFATLNAAVAASQDGDTIAVQAGTYTNDFSTVTHSVTIMGVGGLAHFQSTGLIPNGKAILIDDAANLTVQNLEFSGAQVADSNGAGIRYEAGNLVVKNSYFHDDQDGILGGAVAGGNVTVDGSTFYHDGNGDGQTHAVYLGHINQLTVTNSFFQDMYDGSDVKSRAAYTLVQNNKFIDHATATTNYEVDLPEGGNDTVVGNVMVKSSAASNSSIIHFGGEIANPIGTLLAQNNLFYGERDPTHALLNQSTNQPIQFLNNGMTPTTLYDYVAGNTPGVTVSGSYTIDVNAPPDATLVIPTVSSGTTPPPPNQPPVTTVPGNKTVVDGSSLAFSGISIADADGTAETFTVTLAAVDGVVSTSGGAGTITGNGSSAVTLSGSLASVNADLAALAFKGTAIGAGSLAVTTSDGNGGSDSHTIGVTVTDAPPVTTVPGNQTVLKGSTLALAGIGIADADGANQSFTVTLTGTDGTVSTSGGAGTITGNGTGHVTLTGSLANVNADLAALSFTGTTTGSGSLQIATSDGAGGSDSHTIGITVTAPAVDQPPVTSVPGNQSVVDQSTLALTGISVADADGAGQSFTVTLTGTDGTVSTSGGAGTIAGNGTANLTLSGSLANVNADLAALSFKGTAIGAGSLKIVTSDGAGGSDSHTIGITVTDAIPMTAVPGNQTVVSGSTLALSGIAITDADGANQTFTVTLTGTDGTVSTGGGLGTITGNGTASLTLSGSLANVNADLAKLSFTGTTAGTGALQIVTNDGAGGSDSHAIGITVTALVDAPPVISVPASQNVAVGTTVAIQGVSIADPDGANQNFSVVLTGTDGIVSTTGGAGTIAGNGTGHVTLSGSLAAVNTDLAALSFTGAAVGTGLLQIAAQDGAGGSDSEAVAVYLTAPAGHLLTVGAGQQFSSLSAALSASHDGDTIRLAPGTYSTGAVMVNHAVTIDGSGGAAHLVASKSLSNGSALFTTQANVTFQNLDISGVTSNKHNGVAIRAAAGDLTLTNMSVHGSDAAVSDLVNGSTVQIFNSDFGRNGGGSAPVINIGSVADFELQSSKIHDTVGVTEVRSIAVTTGIGHDQFTDGSGSPLYALDLPNVGNVIIGYSAFSRGTGALNSSLIHLGGGISNPPGYLNVHDSTFVSTASGTHVLYNQALWNSVGFQNDGIGANITQIAVGPAPAVQNDYVIS